MTEAGLGDPDGAVAGSVELKVSCNPTGDCGSSEFLFRACVKAPVIELRPKEPRGEAGTWPACEGEADRDGVLKGMNDTEGRRGATGAPSVDFVGAFEFCDPLVLGRGRVGGEGESEPCPRSVAALSTEIGLEPEGGPI